MRRKKDIFALLLSLSPFKVVDSFQTESPLPESLQSAKDGGTCGGKLQLNIKLEQKITVSMFLEGGYEYCIAASFPSHATVHSQAVVNRVLGRVRTRASPPK